jgi:chromosome segregation ATPase
VRLEAALYDLSQKDESIQDLQEQLRKAEQEISEARNAKKQANDSLSAAQKGAEAKKAKMVDVLQKEVQSLQQQMAKKSAAAQRLLQEKESECTELRKANKALQQELDKGKFEDTHLFELAEKQSNRETSAAAEIEIRDSLLERMKVNLVERDGELARVENHVQEVEVQMEQLCRVRRREDVNLDYLKSIVVQFLSKPPGSSERAALLPVLATLLQVSYEPTLV